MPYNPYEINGFSEGLSNGWNLALKSHQQAMQDKLDKQNMALAKAKDAREQQQLQNETERSKAQVAQANAATAVSNAHLTPAYLQNELDLQRAAIAQSKATTVTARAQADSDLQTALFRKAQLDELNTQIAARRDAAQASMVQPALDVLHDMAKDPDAMHGIMAIHALSMGIPAAIPTDVGKTVGPYVMYNQLQQLTNTWRGAATRPGEHFAGISLIDTHMNPKDGSVVGYPVVRYVNNNGQPILPSRPLPPIVISKDQAYQAINALGAAAMSLDKFSRDNNVPLAQVPDYVQATLIKQRIINPEVQNLGYSGVAIDSTGTPVGPGKANPAQTAYTRSVGDIYNNPAIPTTQIPERIQGLRAATIGNPNLNSYSGTGINPEQDQALTPSVTPTPGLGFQWGQATPTNNPIVPIDQMPAN